MGKMLWDWDRVFEYSVRMCDTHGGYYKLSVEEGAQFKNRAVGKGWGRPNFLENVLPRYRGCYQGYEFGISSHRKYLWCKKLQRH